MGISGVEKGMGKSEGSSRCEDTKVRKDDGLAEAI